MRPPRDKGATVDSVLVNIDSSRSAQLVNDRMCYGAISVARLDARIYPTTRNAPGGRSPELKKSNLPST